MIGSILQCRLFGPTCIAALTSVFAFPMPANADEPTVESAPAVAAAPEHRDGPEDPSLARPGVWLGIQLKEVTGDLAKHLDRSDGVFVEWIVPESPAAQAQLAIGDVLLAVDDQPLDSPSMLLEIMAQQSVAEPQALAFRLLRRGHELTIRVTPAPRPRINDSANQTIESTLSELLEQNGAPAEIRERKEFLKSLRNQGVRVLRFGNPSMVLGDADQSPNEETKTRFEQEVEGGKVVVTIDADAGPPAQITVQQADNVQTLEATDDAIAKLPKELQDCVQTVLKEFATHREARGAMQQMLERRIAIIGDDGQPFALPEGLQMDLLKADLRAHAKQRLEQLKSPHDAPIAPPTEQTEEFQAEIARLKALVEELKAEIGELRNTPQQK
ncbi:PDZ domain-containing protein [Aureliella helgolandensis]|uniref:Serine endoprotease n=1 Tax=Aureliella helgolandensis TaxID=2527968 RepID=A0A518GHM9_9BACT|nr:PDZ domain-containing protein [Aureliella helgolandensis]QDV28102.1 serine endoprotease [Aureliella helgolandensis]